MSDKDLMETWARINDPREALAQIVEHEDFLGYDPYYGDLRKALLDMAERCALTKPSHHHTITPSHHRSTTP